MGKYRSRVQRQWSFADVRLTKEQRLAFGVWCDELDTDVIELLTIVLLQSYKFSMKWDKDGDTWIASLTGDETNRDNAFTSMSGRHSDPERAIMVVLFKHVEICQSGRWEVEDDTDDWG